MKWLLGKTGDSSRGIEYQAGAVREQLAPSCCNIATDWIQDLRVEARWHAHWRAIVLFTHPYQTSVHEYHLCMQAVSLASQRGGMCNAQNKTWGVLSLCSLHRTLLEVCSPAY